MTYADPRLERENLARQLADYEKLSGVLWIVLGAIQICLVVTALAGVWNVFAGLSRLGMARRIRAYDPLVPKAYEGIVQLVVIGIVNFLLGGFIGLVLVGLDFYIRDKVLSNRWAFEGEGSAPVRMTAPGPSVSALDSLEQLGRLRDRAILTAEEFDREKARILSAGPAGFP